MADWKIAGPPYNLYFKPIESDKDDHSFIATRTKTRLKVKNKLIEKADKMDRKRLCWSTINDKSIIDFPKLDLMDMRCLILGSYQIKQSLQYTKEHMSNTGDYDM
jgi:N6-adenosine-specific RNA methylase IME4